jgi:hypothetical protein
MPENEKKEEKKQPIEMTGDELLDYALAPELAAKLREIAQGEKPREPEAEGKEDVDC